MNLTSLAPTQRSTVSTAAPTDPAVSFAPTGAAAALDVYNGSVEVGRALIGGTRAVITSLTNLANAYGLAQSVSTSGGFLTKTVHYTWQGPNQAIVGAYNDLQRWLRRVNGGF